MFGGRRVRITCTILVAVLLGACGISAVYGAGDFTFTGDCSFSGLSWPSVSMDYFINQVNASGYPTFVNANPANPFPAVPFIQGDKKTWSVDPLAVNQTLPYCSLSGLARGSFEWQSNVFQIDQYLQASASGTASDPKGYPYGTAYIQVSSPDSCMLEASTRITGVSLSEGAGYPIYVRLKTTGPVDYQKSSSGPVNLLIYSRDLFNAMMDGPDWSSIWRFDTENKDLNRYRIVQMGDQVRFLFSRGLTYDIYVDSGSGSITQGVKEEITVDARKVATGEYDVRLLGGGTPFTGVSDLHACIYAAMAMIVDYWALPYPQLKKPDQDSYYAAFDKCRNDARLPSGVPCKLWMAVEILNRYFAAYNGCRSGSAVPLVAVGPLATSMASIRCMDNPFILSGPTTDQDGNIIGAPFGKGHSVVVDGYYWMYADPAKRDQREYWLAVRDTWDDGLTKVESAGFIEYVGFQWLNREWWPLTLPTVFKWEFPDKPKLDNFEPNDTIRVAEKAKLNLLLERLFDEDWTDESGSYEAVVGTLGSVEVSFDNPTNPDDEEGRLHVLANAGTQSQVVIPSWATDKVRFGFDYTLSAGTKLTLKANNTTLWTSPTGTGVAFPLSHAIVITNMASLGLSNKTVDLKLFLSGSQPIELYLDNLIVENADASAAKVDLNHDMVVDLQDFALLAESWKKTGSNLEADINRDSVVNAADLIELAKAWGSRYSQ
jgi:hypothetical protein